MGFLSQAHGRDCTAGVAPFLVQLLQSQPQAFTACPAATAAAGAAGAALVRIGRRHESEAGGLLRRLASDGGACCVVSTPSPQGGYSVVCSRRMGELFLSSDEYAGLLAQTGLAPLYFWPL